MYRAALSLGLLLGCSDRAMVQPPPTAPPSDAVGESVALLEAPRKRVLESGASHRYRLPLRRGESCEVVVTQDGVDVVVEAFDPAGVRLAAVDSPRGSEPPRPTTRSPRRGRSRGSPSTTRACATSPHIRVTS